MVRLRIPRRLGVAALALVLLTGTVLYTASARSGGIFDRARDGCGGQGCHGTDPDPDVVPVLEGLPDAWTANATYDLTVRIDGARPVLPTHENEGGFNLEVSAGVLSVPEGADDVQVATDDPPRQATHTTDGNDQRDWRLRWTAPAEAPAGDGADGGDGGADGNATGTVTVWLAVNAVNGNTASDALDQWATATFEVPAADTTGGDGSDGDGGDGDGGDGGGRDVEEIPDDGGEQVPGFAGLAVVSALLAAVWWTKRRR